MTTPHPATPGTSSPSPVATTTSTTLEDRTLRVVLAVAEHGSLRAAARELELAPSAVQRTVVAAERRLGATLFERSAGGARVTELGRIVVRHGQERRDLDALFADEIARTRTPASGEARIAVGLGFLDQLTERVLVPYQRQHPGVRLRVLTGGTDPMVTALAADGADVGIALHPAPHPDITTLRTSPQPLGFACSADHPLARAHADGSPLLPAEIEGHRVATMLPGFGLRALHEEFVRVHGVSVHIGLETDSQAALISAVTRAGAITLMPPVFLAAVPADERVVLLDVEDTHLRAVRAALMVRRGRRLPPAAGALLERCVAWFEAE